MSLVIAGAWKGVIWSWGYLKSLHNGELRSYPRVSKYIHLSFVGFYVTFLVDTFDIKRDSRDMMVLYDIFWRCW